MLKLLAMIPGPDDVWFWNRINEGRYRGHPSLEPEEWSGEDTRGFIDGGYTVKKIIGHLPGTLRGEVQATGLLASYLIVFFDHDSDSLRQAIAVRVGEGFSGLFGQRWIDDMLATAWRVYVTHPVTPRKDLAETWRRRDL
ncbi:hypothetical protein [Frankia sp. ACN1ag]|uniref:hypothetical protein n=1 Tax=Frankia sp. ACN1ag TaxID=102891 RepID=UPI0006DD0732|nr:hypothetical protein [Frankia sp. ACN1ag]KQC35034.1 hypothetical protein UK82_28640 [Frankia sp. ACN1ag]